MTILVLGATGMCGRALARALTQQSRQWIGTAFTRNADAANLQKVDLTDSNSVRALLKQTGPQTIICLAAERTPEACESDPQRTKSLNVTLPKLLAEYCSAAKSRLIHISTEYVFDGTHPPYTPSDTPHPLQAYGRSKLEGEQAVLNALPSALIVRLPVLYCEDVQSLKESSVTSVARQCFDFSGPQAFDNYGVRYPVSCEDVAKLLTNLIDCDLSGIHHFGNRQPGRTKFALAQSILKLTGFEKCASALAALASPPTAVARPRDTELEDSSLDTISPKRTPVDEGLQRALAPWIHSFRQAPPLILSDLDGTLIDTERLHFDAYNLALIEVMKSAAPTLLWQDYERVAHVSGDMKEFLASGLQVTEQTAQRVYETKSEIYTELLKTHPIPFIQGAEQFLTLLPQFKLRCAVVTNSRRSSLNILQSRCPALGTLVELIGREDYTRSKPAPDGYELARGRHAIADQTIVGIENSIVGLKSLYPVTRAVYFISGKRYPFVAELDQFDVFKTPDLSVLNNRILTD